MHSSITPQRVMRAVQKNNRDCDSYIGFCKACGKTANNCEPDARNYTCHKCGKPEVFGAEELLMEIA